jgi:hypothetical protein
LHGEYKATLLRCPDAASHVHSTFKSPTGATHGVDVEAQTLYEAAGIGLARLKRDGWIEGLGPGSRLEIGVRKPSPNHSLTVAQLPRWVDAVTTIPTEIVDALA